MGWARITKKEMNKGFEIMNLKKGELQIELAKTLVKLDEILEIINFALQEMNEYSCGLDDGVFSTAEQALKKIIKIVKGGEESE